MAVPAPGSDADWGPPPVGAPRSAAPAPRYNRSNGAAPPPGRSGDRIPPPGRSGGRIPPAGAGAATAVGAPPKPRKPKATGKNARGSAKKKAAAKQQAAARKAPPKPQEATGGLAPVYDIDGPRVRLGVAWFLVAVLAVAASTITAAACYAVAAGFASRQVVRAWKSVPWQADLAAGLSAAVVLGSVLGTIPAVGVAVVALVVVLGVSFGHPDGGRIPGAQGRVAAALILVMALVPALGGVTLTLVRQQDITAALVLLLLVSAYEASDYIVGSGASNFVEGPLAGITTALVLGFPLSLVLMPPFDDAGWQLLVFVALTLPLGQIMASALLPRAAANAPALRRIDTLLLLAPIWAAAASAF